MAKEEKVPMWCSVIFAENSYTCQIILMKSQYTKCFKIKNQSYSYDRSSTLEFETSHRFTCMIHQWKAKTLLFPMMCCNVNLVQPFGYYALLNTGSTAENLRSRHDHNLSAWNQYYRPSCMSYSIEIQS